MGYQLVERSGPTAGKVHTLDQEEIFIGRDLNNDIVINNPEVSRRHCRLLLQGLNYVVEDLGSTNGTFVNGQRLSGPHILYPGEVMTLGETITLVYESTQPHSDATIVSGQIEDPGATMQAQPMYEEPAQAAPPPQPVPETPDAYDPYRALPEEPVADSPYAAPEPYDMAGVDYGAPPAVEPVPAPAPSQSSFAGEVKTGKRKIPPVGIVIGILVILLLCVCAVGGYVIDSQNMYCDQLSFLFADILGLCP